MEKAVKIKFRTILIKNRSCPKPYVSGDSLVLKITAPYHPIRPIIT